MFNARSARNLAEVHPKLQLLFNSVWQVRKDFIVTDGLRTAEEQQALFAAGATKILNSRHLTGHAVDVALLVQNKVRWDWPLYDGFAQTVKAVASDFEIEVLWGGDWKIFRDGPHYELDCRFYP